MSEAMRTSAGLDDRRKKLLFRAWHRGMREMDYVLGMFANDTIADLNNRELDEFESLMKLPDPDTYKWLSGAEDVPQDLDSSIVRKIRKFHLSRT